MASSSVFPDIFSWIQNLPPVTQWKTNSFSLCISSSTCSQPSLNLSVSKNHENSTLSFTIVADFSLPVSLWTSKPLKFNSNSTNKPIFDDETISSLLVNFVKDVLHYGFSNHNNNFSLLKFPKLNYISNQYKDIFNLAFLTLLFLVCIYEAPTELRLECLNNLKNHLANCQSRKGTKLLMKLLGSNLEEQWMRSINLAITNWIVEFQATSRTLKTPSSLFSYAISTFGLWKVQLYCPVIAMHTENSSNNPLADERLYFSLNFHQLEGVLQFNYKVMIQKAWVSVILNIDNIRYFYNSL